MQPSLPARVNYRQWILMGLCILIALCFIVAYFERIDIEGTGLGIDWRYMWRAIEHGQVDYDRDNIQGGWLRNPPWSLVLLLPLSYLSMQSSWGLLNFFTLAVLIVSVPRVRPRWRFWLAVTLLVSAQPTLAHFANGNVEGFVIAGILLMLYAYDRQRPYLLALGMLLATAKPQNVVLLLGVLALYMLNTWHWRDWMKAGFVALIIMLFTTLWIGQGWLNAMLGQNLQGSVGNLTLQAALRRSSVSVPIILLLWMSIVGLSLFVAWRGNRQFSREKAGLLVAASLLVSPYANALGIVTLLAVGIIALFLSKPIIGLPLIIAADVPLFMNQGFPLHWQYTYWTLLLLVMWGVLLMQVYYLEISPRSKVAYDLTASLQQL